MKSIFKSVSGAALAFGFIVNAQAAIVSVTMTADNIVSGGVCSDATCTTIDTSWSSLGPMTNSDTWQLADTVSVDLVPGIYSLAWLIGNVDSPAAVNPAALLAEFSANGNTFSSSSAWEVFDSGTGAFIASATEYGANGQAGVIWTDANSGQPISGISGDAQWLYSANNFENAEESVWIRTTFEVTDIVVPVSAPAMFSVFGALALFMAFRRTK